GTLIDLFDPKLAVYSSRSIAPGEQGYFLNVDLVKDKKRAQVLAGANRVYEEHVQNSSYSYLAKSPIQTSNISRILLPKQPNQVKVNGTDVFEQKNWDAKSKTYLLGYENNPDGVKVEFTW